MLGVFLIFEPYTAAVEGWRFPSSLNIHSRLGLTFPSVVFDRTGGLAAAGRADRGRVQGIQKAEGAVRVSPQAVTRAGKPSARRQDNIRPVVLRSTLVAELNSYYSRKRMTHTAVYETRRRTAALNLSQGRGD